MRIKCYNPKCLHERNYDGKFTEDDSIITCTKCRNKLRLGKAKILNEVEVPHSIPHKVTSQSEYRKEIVTPKTETIEEKNLDTKEGRDAEKKRLDEEYKTLPELPGKELSYDELPSEIGGVKIKNNG